MNERYCLDSNVFIDSWKESYPSDVFPSLWKQIADHGNSIILLRPIYDEIKDDSLRDWLKENLFSVVSVDGGTEELSLRWEKNTHSIKRGESERPYIDRIRKEKQQNSGDF